MGGKQEKLPRLTGTDMLKALCNEGGFTVLRQKGSHVLVKKETPEGTITLPIPVHGDRELGRSLVNSIIKEAGMTTQQFAGLLKK